MHRKPKIIEKLQILTKLSASYLKSSNKIFKIFFKQIKIKGVLNYNQKEEPFKLILQKIKRTIKEYYNYVTN